MATVNYSLSSKLDASTGKSEILIRFVGGRNLVFRIKSGIHVSSNRWNSDTGRLIIPRIESPEQKELVKTQKYLHDLENHLIHIFHNTSRENVNKAWITRVVDEYHFPEKYNQKDRKELSFFEAFDLFLATRKLSEIRKKNYNVVIRALKRFELFQARTSERGYKLDLGSLSTDTIRSFEHFFMHEHEIFYRYPDIYKAVPECRKPKVRGLNTLNCDLTKLRTFTNWLLEQQIISQNPFHGFEMAEAIYGTPIYISIEERNSLFNADLSSRPQLEIQRDIFIFHCLIGCRVSDLFSFTKDSIINNAIEYIARKTKEGRPITVRVPLNTISSKIIQKYAELPGKALLPFISQQKYNDAIKEMFKLAGLTRMVTILNPTTREEEKKPLNEVASSHLARRTFVGNLFRKVKDPNLVGSLTGHKEGSRSFARYRDIDDDIKKELVNLLE